MEESERESENEYYSREKGVQDDKITLVIKIKIISAIVTVLGSGLMALNICLWCHDFTSGRVPGRGSRNYLTEPDGDEVVYTGNHSFIIKNDTKPGCNLTHPGGNQTHPFMDRGIPGVNYTVHTTGNNTGNNTGDNTGYAAGKPPAGSHFPNFVDKDHYPKIDKEMYPGFDWVPLKPGDKAPPGAVNEGIDIDNSPIYVSRALYAGDLIPGKFIAQKDKMFVSRDKWEHAMGVHYQVLVGWPYGWMAAAFGKVPKNAILGGYTDYFEYLYICRVTHENTVTIGKVHRSHKCCYIPYDGQELRYSYYEVLVAL